MDEAYPIERVKDIVEESREHKSYQHTVFWQRKLNEAYEEGVGSVAQVVEAMQGSMEARLQEARAEGWMECEKNYKLS